MEECTTLSAKVKEAVEQFYMEHDNFKANLNTPSVSNRGGSRASHNFLLGACSQGFRMHKVQALSKGEVIMNGEVKENSNANKEDTDKFGHFGRVS